MGGEIRHLEIWYHLPETDGTHTDTTRDKELKKALNKVLRKFEDITWTQGDYFQ